MSGSDIEYKYKFVNERKFNSMYVFLILENVLVFFVDDDEVLAAKQDTVEVVVLVTVEA